MHPNAIVYHWVGRRGCKVVKSDKSLWSAWHSTRSRVGKMLAVLALSSGVGLGASGMATATSPPWVVENVGIISVHVDVSGDLPVRHLLDDTLIQNELVAYLAERLLDERPDIEVTGTRVEIEPTVLWVLVDITVRTDPQGANDLPCCLGAITVLLVRVDPDSFGPPVGLLTDTSTEPFFAGADPDQATERVTELLEAELDGTLNWLTTLGAHHVLPRR